LLAIDEPPFKSDFLKAGDQVSGTFLDDADKFACFDQAVVRPRVEPCIAAPHALDEKLAALHVNAVQIGDLQFAAR
jgi:hypothetical protein